MRNVVVNLSATVATKASIYAQLRWWERLPKVNALRWGVSGDDLHRKSGRWSVVIRTFDRAKDWYYEHITDKETGQILRHVEKNSATTITAIANARPGDLENSSGQQHPRRCPFQSLIAARPSAKDVACPHCSR